MTQGYPPGPRFACGRTPWRMELRTDACLLSMSVRGCTLLMKKQLETLHFTCLGWLMDTTSLLPPLPLDRNANYLLQNACSCRLMLQWCLFKLLLLVWWSWTRATVDLFQAPRAYVPTAVDKTALYRVMHDRLHAKQYYYLLLLLILQEMLSGACDLLLNNFLVSSAFHRFKRMQVRVG
jgi:hypothetical protein